MRRTTRSPSAFVPQAPTARERNRATPRPRTTSGRTNAAKPKNWSAAVGEGGADASRPVARAGVGVGDGREERRVVRVVGEERRDEEETGRQDEDAEELVAPAVRGFGRPGAFGHRRQRRPASEDRGAEERGVDDERLELHGDDETQEGRDGDVADDGGGRHPGEVDAEVAPGRHEVPGRAVLADVLDEGRGEDRRDREEEGVLGRRAPREAGEEAHRDRVPRAREAVEDGRERLEARR